MRMVWYHLPKGENVSLIDPPPGELPRLLAENRRRLRGAHFSLAGAPFAQVLARAREDAAARAAEYCDLMGVAATPLAAAHSSPPDTFVACGHQPGFLHPGVWIKNHLVGRLAGQCNACGLNVVIDTDTPGNLDFRVPRRLGREMKVEHFRCLNARADLPLEEQQLDDPHRVAELPEKVRPLLEFESARPLAARYLGHLAESARGKPSISHLLTFARRKTEEDEGLHNLELPFSAACGFDGFLLLVLEVLRRADEFASTYNRRLAEYRRIFKVRGKANPLPDLAIGGARIELPLWISRAGRPRHSLHIERSNREIILLLEGEHVWTLSAGQLENAAAGIEALENLTAAGIRLRPKALVTTIYIRLLLCDLFVHGIGGGNYDIITDEIIRDFFGFEPPVYAVATANVSMPFERFNVSGGSVSAIRHDANRLQMNPANFADALLPGDHELPLLLSERHRLLDELHAALYDSAKRALFVEMKKIDAHLRAKVSVFADEKMHELAAAQKALGYNAIAAGRDYPFCIYPEEVLRQVFAL